MKKQNPAGALQGGITLIELLISITIGLVILIAIGAAYVNSTNLTRQRENQSELNDPSAFAMRMMRRDISQAGYVDVFDTDTTTNKAQAATLLIPGNEAKLNLYVRATTLPAGTPFDQFFPGLSPIYGCDGAMDGTPNAISTTAGAATLACGTASATKHSLQIAYQAASSTASTAFPSLLAASSPAAVAAGEGRDCNQQSLTAAPAGGGSPARQAKFAINRYFLADNNGVSELYCAGSGNAIPQPIARGIEEFVVRYQTAQPGSVPAAGAPWVTAPNAQEQYASAATVAGSTLGWSKVTAVEVCMVAATSVTGGAAAQGTTQLQTSRPTCERESTGEFKANVARVAGDMRLWKRFTFVTTARNAIFSTPL